MITNPTMFGMGKIVPTNIIKLPKALQYKFERKVKKARLKKIHKDTQVAKELCYLFIAQLTLTIFETEEDKIWKRLYSKYLKDLYRYSGTTYYEIYKLLSDPSNGLGAIIERKKDDNGNDLYFINESSIQYRITEDFRTNKSETYELLSQEVIKLNTRQYWTILHKTEKNPIVKSIMWMYSNVEFPSIEEITEIGKQYAKEGRLTKKGKIITYLGKHSRNKFIDRDNRSFVEDSIELFKYLTEKGFALPKVSSTVTNGGRVIDSFTLMPSWIRELATINGVSMKEFDFSCFHPNIANKIYGTEPKAYTHQMIADHLGKSVLDVKIANLSFFNLPPNQMKQSAVYPYYMQVDPNMVNNIIADKVTSNSSTTTTYKMFKLEVDIMSQAIEELLQENIHVLYVYDAVLCHPDDYNRVSEVMYQVAQENGVYTRKKKSDGTYEDFDLVSVVVETECKLLIKQEAKAKIERLSENEVDFIKQQPSYAETAFQMMLANFNEKYGKSK